MVRSNVIRLFAFWLVVTSLILVTACSKKGGDQPAPAAPAAETVPTGSELNADSSQSAQEPRDSENGVNPAGLPEAQVTWYDPTGLTPDQIFNGPSASVSALSRGTGAMANYRSVDGTQMYYSGAGQDELLQRLKEIASSESSPAVRQANQELAAAIGISTVDIDWYSRRVQLHLQIRQNGYDRRYTFNTYLDNANTMRFGDLNRAPYLAGEAVCMDASGGCRTVKVRLQENTYGGLRTAHYIIRETRSYMFVQGKEPEYSANSEYARLMTILLRTVKFPGQNDTVSDLTMTTTEVAYGSATFVVTMRMRLRDPLSPYPANQLLVWAGPLIKPDTSNHLNLRLSPVPSATTIDGVPVQISGLISDTLRETRLIRNSGDGNLQLLITVRSTRSNVPEESLRLTVGRIHTPARETGL